jgi:hypothetical protein
VTWDNQQIQTLTDALARYDRPVVSALCNHLVAELRADSAPPDEAQVIKVLKLLQGRRFFSDMEPLADAAILAGAGIAEIRRRYAQALIEGGRLAAAVHQLRLIIDAPTSPRAEVIEARGLLGRAFKQQYVFARGGGAARDALEQALSAYLGVYSADPSNIWHGINAVALLERARRDGIALAAHPSGSRLARRVLDEARGREKLESWDLATAAEASLAVRDVRQAVQWLKLYAAHEQTDAFAIASTLRQLEEIWQLDEGKGPGRSLLPLLRSQLLRRANGRIDLSPTQVWQAKQPTPLLLADSLKRQRRTHLPHQRRYEAMLGKDGFVTLAWYRIGIDRCRLVARIVDQFGSHIGTGFLMRAGQLAPGGPSPDEPLLVTNAHVLSTEDFEAWPPDEVKVVFDALDDAKPLTFEVDSILWSSPRGALDFTVARLKNRRPEVASPFPLAKKMPDPAERRRVYLIGHPEGRPLTLSMQDNVILDCEAPLLHYHAPTEPGSSGSPVFNDQWELVALHHAGDKKTRRLHNQPGNYPANEGILLEDIRRHIAGQPALAVHTKPAKRPTEAQRPRVPAIHRVTDQTAIVAAPTRGRVRTGEVDVTLQLGPSLLRRRSRPPSSRIPR